MEITTKEYPQFGLSVKIGNKGMTYAFKNKVSRKAVINEIERSWKKGGIEYTTFDIPSCCECKKESEVES